MVLSFLLVGEFWYMFITNLNKYVFYKQVLSLGNSLHDRLRIKYNHTSFDQLVLYWNWKIHLLTLVTLVWKSLIIYYIISKRNHVINYMHVPYHTCIAFNLDFSIFIYWKWDFLFTVCSVMYVIILCKILPFNMHLKIEMK